MHLRLRSLAAAGLVLAAAAAAFAQSNSANPIITMLTGSELVQIQPANTAAIAYATTSNLRDGRGYLQASPVSGATVSMTTAQSALQLTPAGTLATLTLNLPPTQSDGKTVTLFTTQTITALTVNATTSGATVVNPPTTLTANASALGYIYNATAKTWSRFQ